MIEQMIYIRYKGQDFRPVYDVDMEISRDGKEYKSLDKLGESENVYKANKDSILHKFLEEIAPNGLLGEKYHLIGYSDDRATDKNDRKLYSTDFGPDDKEYFGGIVGVISKTLKWSMENGDEEDARRKEELNITLQIQTRVDSKARKPYFLATMLMRDVLTLDDDNKIPSDEEELFDFLLLFRFKEHLNNAILKGYYKTYRHFEKNDDRVKGSIDIARHIKLNMGQHNGSIAYSYRENTIDNYLNYLIVAAYEHLKRKYPELVFNSFGSNPALSGAISYLKNETGYTKSSSSFLIKRNDRIISHPYFTEYEDLRLTCIRILRDENISLFDGNEQDDTRGILFYLPDLWELYLEDEMISRIESVSYEAQKSILNFGIFDENNGLKFSQKTKPDYTFSIDEEDNSRTIMILDAKFKPEKWNKAVKEKRVSAVMEDYNKCIRDMVSANTHATGVIYPIYDKGDDKLSIDRTYCEHPISELNREDMFYTFPVFIPMVGDNDDYSMWRERLDKKVTDCRNILKKIVDRERNYISLNVSRGEISYPSQEKEINI